MTKDIELDPDGAVLRATRESQYGPGPTPGDVIDAYNETPEVREAFGVSPAGELADALAASQAEIEKWKGRAFTADEIAAALRSEVERLTNSIDKEVYSRVEHWRSAQEALIAERDALRAALEKIASEDYRGPRPTSIDIASAALQDKR